MIDQSERAHSFNYDIIFNTVHCRRSSSRNQKPTERYDPMKSNRRSRKKNADSSYDSVAYDPRKTSLLGSETEAEE